MLESMKDYVYERRWRLTRAATVTGSVYFCGRYTLDRVEEVRYAVVRDKLAREYLRRRFQQNHEDTIYTIMALVPALGEQILREMDVEEITHELQSRSNKQRTRTAPSPLSTQPQQLPASPLASSRPPPSESSLASSVDLLADHDARSEASISFSSVSGSAQGQDRENGQDSGSTNGADRHDAEAASLSSGWIRRASIDASASPSPSSPAQHFSFSLSPPSPSTFAHAQATDSPVQESETLPANVPPLSDSVTTSSSILSYAAGESSMSATGPRTAQSTASIPPSEFGSAASADTRSKAELWREVKTLTFTRTLTILYSTTLLSLFTTVQLSVLGRSKYVQAVSQQEREERMNARKRTIELAATRTGMLIVSKMLAGLNDQDEDGEGETEVITEEVEMVYLTLSWWLLHVGWKDIGERVRRGVEEVFDNVSLKTKVGPSDLHRLLSDVRRRVEHEVTFEGRDRQINFMSALLPPTTETMHHVLSQGGVTPASIQHATTTRAFRMLVDETHELLSSANFARVLDVALDRAVGVLFQGLEKNVFGESKLTNEGGPAGAGEVKLRLAGLLPALARWCHLALNALPNDLVDGVTGIREVSALSAIIFARFEDQFR